MITTDFVSRNGTNFRFTWGTEDSESLPDPIFSNIRRGDDLVPSIDRAYGFGGDDILRESPNIDHLFGGEGADIFMFSLDGGTDLIKDFEDGIDKIDLSGWGVQDVAELEIRLVGGGKLALSIPGQEDLIVDSPGRTLRPEDLTNDDFIFSRQINGTDADDKLRGDDDHDFIVDGGGSDNLFGGKGMDVFHLVADGRSDWIKDFNPLFDRIDLSEWAASDDFSFASLDVQNGSNDKVVISYEDEALFLRGAFRPLTAEEIDASHFIF